jgi:uncharacterized protein (TIGR02271 family)
VPHSTDQLVVIDQDGIRGQVDAQALERHDQTHVVITYDGDRHVQLPIAMMQQQADGTYHVPLRLRSLEATAEQQDAAKETVIPIIHEKVQIDKQAVETGRIRLTKTVHVDEETVDAQLQQERVQVERVPLEQFVEQPPQVRYEGETLVIPVVAEMLVVEKRLLLKEEVRIRKYVEEIHHQEPVTLRREEISVERTETSS